MSHSYSVKLKTPQTLIRAAIGVANLQNFVCTLFDGNGTGIYVNDD